MPRRECRSERPIMKLRAADVSDFSTVLEWVGSEEETRIWAGPQIRYPATPETAWFDMAASSENTYALVDETADMIGLGQVVPRDHHVLHLARLIVDPKLRGQRVGRCLCVALVDMAAAKFHTECFTLNVYESNTAARRLYQSMGFNETGRTESGAVAMVRPATRSHER